MSTKKRPKPQPLSLREMLENATPPFTDLAVRLLFCTSLHAGGSRYRIRDLEIYCSDDPYTHRGDEQVSTCGGWYFHRTKPGGGWKGGTYMGLDISFAPVGTAGGVLIRGLSRCDDGQYFDGPCICTRELLKACGVSKIKNLVDKSEFCLSALTEDGIMRLMEHEPLPLQKNDTSTMEWKASSRVGLSVPEKRPEQIKGRKKYHLKPYRFLSSPFETKKEISKINDSMTSGVFTLQDYQACSATTESGYMDENDDDKNKMGLLLAEAGSNNKNRKRPKTENQTHEATASASAAISTTTNKMVLRSHTQSTNSK